MNKKLLITAVAVALSVGCAHAASDITGITPTGNTFNINPAKFNGDVGFRKYTNFKLENGDKANMIFERNQAGKPDPTAFVNLVQNGVNINGVLNTVRNGNFYNGHLVFITPSGLTIGSSGVLNVGQLSVATPTASKFNSLSTEYDANNFVNIQQVNKLKQDSNAPITVAGKILARRGVDMRGTDVTVAGKIVNGVSNNAVFNSKTEADTLFDNLVNTNGTFKSGVDFVSDGGRILLKSNKTGGMNVSGIVTNGKGDVYLTNNEGAGGMTVSGKVNSNTLTRLYSENGNLSVTNDAELKAPEVIVQNRGTGLSLAGDVKATTVATVQNEGGHLTLTNSNIEAPTVKILNAQGAGKIQSAGNAITATDGVYFVNKGAGIDMEGLDLTNNTKNTTETAINNFNGDLKISSSNINTKGNTAILNRAGNGKVQLNDLTLTNNNGDIRIVNKAAGGLEITDSTIQNVGDLRIYNDAGKLNLSTANGGGNTIQNTGDVYIGARYNSTGMNINNTSISNNGNMYIRNKGAAAGNTGMNIASTASISNQNGTLAINNDRGNMNVDGNVSIQNGQMGIINRAGGGNMMLADTGNITINNAYTNIKNNGQGNMTVNGVISNTAGNDYSGRVNIIANNGALAMNGAVHNNAGAINGLDGGFYAVVRQNGTGLTVGNQFVVDGDGEVLIKNISGNDGLTFNGTMNTTGHQAALSNKAGNLNVNGSMTTTNAPIIIYNAATAGDMNVNSTAVLNSGTEGKLINTAANPMHVDSNASVTNMRKYGNK